MSNEPVMRVRYKSSEVDFSLVADVRKCDLDRLLAKIPNETPEYARGIKRSVIRALERAVRNTRAGYKMTKKEAQDVANDIGIWFAYEVFEGRATFEPTPEA